MKLSLIQTTLLIGGSGFSTIGIKLAMAQTGSPTTDSLKTSSPTTDSLKTSSPVSSKSGKTSSPTDELLPTTSKSSKLHRGGAATQSGEVVPIPDASRDGAAWNFYFSESCIVAGVAVNTTIVHGDESELGITVQSPYGKRGNTIPNDTTMMLHGGDSRGWWNVEVKDRKAGNTGAVSFIELGLTCSDDGDNEPVRRLTAAKKVLPNRRSLIN